MRIKIFWVGKTKNASIRSLVADYLARMNHLVKCQVVEGRDPGRRSDLNGASLLAAEAAELSKLIAGSGRIVALDEGGRQFASTEFARWLQAEQNRGTREIAFVIGGPEGLDPTMKEGAHMVLSLGRCTWTHEMSRVLLMEQIYRAFTILRNIPYHK